MQWPAERLIITRLQKTTWTSTGECIAFLSSHLDCDSGQETSAQSAIHDGHTSLTLTNQTCNVDTPAIYLCHFIHPFAHHMQCVRIPHISLVLATQPKMLSVCKADKSSSRKAKSQ